MQAHLVEHHSGLEKIESEEQKAESIVARKMMSLRWQEKDLKIHAKGDPGKVRNAAHLRKETAVTLKWIVQRLHMGTWTYLSNRLYWAQ